MELMPGITLRELIAERGALPSQEAIARILDVIDGLQAAHRLEVIHRDVKPSNCFLEADGRVKVGDFGLAKSLVQDAHLTKSGAFVGFTASTGPTFASAAPSPLTNSASAFSVTWKEVSAPAPSSTERIGPPAPPGSPIANAPHVRF